MEANATKVEGFAGTDAGQALYNLLESHGLTLEDWSDLHPADKRFLRMGAIESGKRREEARKENERNAG